ncbi:MAG: AI-2E family transporter [Clostridiaceae bacterium]|nr:AI-2E family transporter [Clostridiaceae bacterium]
MEDIRNITQKIIIKTVILIGVILLIILNFTSVINIVRNISRVFFPLMLGAGIAYVLNILVLVYEKVYFPKSKNKILISTRRAVSIFLSILTIAAVLLFFILILIPQVNQFVKLLIEKFPLVYENVVEWVSTYADQLPLLEERLKELNMDGNTALGKGISVLSKWAGGTVSIVGTIFGGIMNFILAMFFSIYILFSKEDLKHKFDKLLNSFVKADKKKKIYNVLQTANESFSSYIIGQFKEAVIIGVLCTLGMWIFRFPYATVIGSVIGLTALIPLVGAYIGAAVGFLLILAVNPIKALLFLLFIVILQQVEGNVIYPKVVGESVGLPGIWVFAAITVGGGLMGIPGILFGVPIFATLYKLLSQAVNERQKLKGAKES